MSTSKNSSGESMGKTNNPQPTGGLLSRLDEASATKPLDANFQSGDIGVKTAQKVDTFEKQRRESEAEAEKKKKLEKNTRKTMAAIIAIIAVAIAIVVIIVILINNISPEKEPETTVTELPQISTGSDEEILENYQTALSASNNGYDLEYVENLFNTGEESDQALINENLLSQVSYYMFVAGTGLSSEERAKIKEERVILFEQIDPSGFSHDVLYRYYNIGHQIYQSVDREKSNDFYQKLYELDYERTLTVGDSEE